MHGLLCRKQQILLLGSACLPGPDIRRSKKLALAPAAEAAAEQTVMDDLFVAASLRWLRLPPLVLALCASPIVTKFRGPDAHWSRRFLPPVLAFGSLNAFFYLVEFADCFVEYRLQAQNGFLVGLVFAIVFVATAPRAWFQILAKAAGTHKFGRR
jgi:hypothetical protein